MTDIVQRLRQTEGRVTRYYRNPDGPEAADEIERLQAEVEQQRLELGITEDACGMLESEVKQLRAERDALRDAFERYGAHDLDCMYSDDTYNDGPWPCTCGFSDALAAREGK
jgi:hypothetical protein